MTAQPEIKTVLHSSVDWDNWSYEIGTLAKAREVDLLRYIPSARQDPPVPPRIEEFTREHRTKTGELDLPLMHYHLALYHAQVKNWEIKDVAYRRQRQAKEEVFLAMMRSLAPNVVNDLSLIHADPESCAHIYNSVWGRFG